MGWGTNVRVTHLTHRDGLTGQVDGVWGLL